MSSPADSGANPTASLIDLHDIARRAAAELRARDPGSPSRRLEICLQILSGNLASVEGSEFADGYASATRSEKHYLLGALYVLLMSAERRRLLSAYFTPPAICDHVISRLTDFGFQADRHTALDPACGGAAFLVPLAERMLASADTPADLRGRLSGIEIEPGLAALSESLVADVLSVGPEGDKALRIVSRENALKHSFEGELFDLVVSNPPYGRVFRPKPAVLQRWSSVISDGHVNSYSLFVALSLDAVRPGGLVALVLPTSFLSGPYFAKLRERIRRDADVLQVDLIEKRAGAFLDVVQDTCLLFLRRRATNQMPSATAPPFGTIDAAGVVTERGNLQLSPSQDGEWILPPAPTEKNAPRFFDRRYATLEDYGYEVRAGYFVWNRSLKLLANRRRPLKGEVPLIWAENIRANQPIVPRARDLPGSKATANMISCVRIEASSAVVLKGKAVILQRTTNRRQPHRLIAGYMKKGITKAYGGVVTENHTIVLVAKSGAKPQVTPRKLAALLNSRSVDGVYRRMAGTASVSIKLLRKLPLPSVRTLLDALAVTDDIELAVSSAYLETGKLADRES